MRRSQDGYNGEVDVIRKRKRRMKEPLTEELLEELLSSSAPDKFSEKHRIDERSLSEYLQFLLDEKGLRRAEAVRKAGINDTFGYEIFMGRKNPTRNYVLQIAFAFELDLRETNRLLKIAKSNELYCKVRRDAIIIFCINKKYDLQKTDEELYRLDEETIC